MAMIAAKTQPDMKIFKAFLFPRSGMKNMFCNAVTRAHPRARRMWVTCVTSDNTIATNIFPATKNR